METIVSLTQWLLKYGPYEITVEKGWLMDYSSFPHSRQPNCAIISTVRDSGIDNLDEIC